MSLEIFDDEPAPSAPAPTNDAIRIGLMEILPADFPLPALIKFVPDPRIKAALDLAVEKAVKLKIENGGEAALAEADARIGDLALALKAADEHFEQPAKVADSLHKHITGTRATWKAQAQTLRELLGKQIYKERRRLDALAEEERRKVQLAANLEEQRKETERAQAAAKAGAPAPVVEKMIAKAATVQAPPVPARTAPKLPQTTIVKKYRGRLKGTPADADPHPAITEISDLQWEQGLKPLLAYLLANAPGTFRAALSINWSAIDARANDDKKSFSIPGLESFEDGGVRAKPIK